MYTLPRHILLEFDKIFTTKKYRHFVQANRGTAGTTTAATASRTKRTASNIIAQVIGILRFRARRRERQRSNGKRARRFEKLLSRRSQGGRR